MCYWDCQMIEQHSLLYHSPATEMSFERKMPATLMENQTKTSKASKGRTGKEGDRSLAGNAQHDSEAKLTASSLARINNKTQLEDWLHRNEDPFPYATSRGWCGLQGEVVAGRGYKAHWRCYMGAPKNAATEPSSGNTGRRTFAGNFQFPKDGASLLFGMREASRFVLQPGDGLRSSLPKTFVCERNHFHTLRQNNIIDT